MSEQIVLATILHDSEANLAAPLMSAGPVLRKYFTGIAVNLTVATDSWIAEILEGV